MKRVNVNLFFDVGAFLAFLSLLSTGLLLEFRLPSGSGGHLPYGYGHRALDRPIETILNLTRHEWGEVHFWIACCFVVVITIHLILHWKWIGSMCKNLINFTHGSSLIFITATITLVFLLALPLLSPKDQATLREQQAIQSATQGEFIPD